MSKRDKKNRHNSNSRQIKNRTNLKEINLELEKEGHSRLKIVEEIVGFVGSIITIVGVLHLPDIKNMREILVQWYCLITLLVAVIGVVNYLLVIGFMKFFDYSVNTATKAAGIKSKVTVHGATKYCAALLLLGLWVIEFDFVKELVTTACSPAVTLAYFIFQYTAIILVILLNIIFSGLYLFKNYKWGDVLRNYPMEIVILAIIWILAFFAVFMLMMWMPISN